MELVNKESTSQTMSEQLRIDAAIVRAAIISETLVFCTLALLGGGLFALFATTQLNWYYPTVFYGVVVYIAWQRYFGISVRVGQATQLTSDQEVAQRATEEATRQSLRATERVVEQGLREATERTDKVLRETEKATHEAELRVAVFSALGTTDYDALTSEEVSRRIEGLPAERLRKVREYEKNNKNRETLIGEIDRKIKANS